ARLHGSRRLVDRWQWLCKGHDCPIIISLPVSSPAVDYRDVVMFTVREGFAYSVHQSIVALNFEEDCGHAGTNYCASICAANW
ncbi:MAG TPA: hypothetical protein PKA58_37700, partial [Polyangium sp.]|nr:hypothetical protein [Polyangium sp.]